MSCNLLNFKRVEILNCSVFSKSVNVTYVTFSILVSAFLKDSFQLAALCIMNPTQRQVQMLRAYWQVISTVKTFNCYKANPSFQCEGFQRLLVPRNSTKPSTLCHLPAWFVYQCTWMLNDKCFHMIMFQTEILFSSAKNMSFYAGFTEKMSKNRQREKKGITLNKRGNPVLEFNVPSQ